MSHVTRRLPDRPHLDVPRREARELLDDWKQGRLEALDRIRAQHPRLSRLTREQIATAPARLSDAQWVIAREYTYDTWADLKHRIEVNEAAVALQQAIRDGNVSRTVALLSAHPTLLHLPLRSRNWGAPLSYAANLGQLAVMEAIARLGATDHQHALFRAILQGHLDCAAWLLLHGARATPGLVMGPCETLNCDGLAFLAEAGAPFTDARGNPLAPLAMVLKTYSRHAQRKHACLAVFERLGYRFPETAPMAFHRGRIDLLEKLLSQEPALLSRRFTLADLYPPEICGTGPEAIGMCATPLDGGTLLHFAIDYAEQEIFDWLLAHGAEVNARATVGPDGFGGHAPLFNAVVPGRPRGGEMGRALLARGADPTLRANLRKFVDWTERPAWHEAIGVTPREWGQGFPEKDWINADVLALLQGS